MSRPRYHRGREYTPAPDEVLFVLIGAALAVELGLSVILVARLFGWW